MVFEKAGSFFIGGRNRSVIIKDDVKKAQHIRSFKNSILKNNFTPSPTSSIWQIMLQIFKKVVAGNISALETFSPGRSLPVPVPCLV